MLFPALSGPIGIFDSGYGGLTVFEKIKELMPQYDYIYLGDNARAPYGTRSFDVVYEYTRQSVEKLFELNCPLVILACNTASYKALKTIQAKDLPHWNPERRVLGIIRPTAEMVGNITKTRHVGILGTESTIQSGSYPVEIKKGCPDIVVSGEACPIWVSLVENAEHNSDGADYFVKKHITNLLQKDGEMDTIILACTHYPLLLPKIEQYCPKGINIISQGDIVAESLKNYLHHHPEIEMNITRGGYCRFFTTESVSKFQKTASLFLRTEGIKAERIIF